MRNRIKGKRRARMVRHRRVRAKIFGTAERPRLSVFRSSRHLYAQLIDDVSEMTLLSASDYGGKSGKSVKKGVDRAALAGEELAKAAIGRGIRKVVFDRGGFAYHGRVKALAEAARKTGLEF